LFAFLPRCNDGAAPLVDKHDSSALTFLEISGGDLAPVDERQRKPVSEDRAEFFLQIQSKRRAARAHCMQKTELRIQPGSFACRAAVIHQHSIEEGNQRIETVQRWPAATPVERERGACLRFDDEVERSKITACRFALYAAQLIHIFGDSCSTQ